MVCEGREDLHYYNLSITERVILKHIEWRVSMIADPKEIDRCYVEAVNKKYSDYPDFYPESDYQDYYPESDYQSDDSGFYPENDYPHYYPESDYESDDSGFFDDCDAKCQSPFNVVCPFGCCTKSWAVTCRGLAEWDVSVLFIMEYH
jgi:hypothetical protein